MREETEEDRGEVGNLRCCSGYVVGNLSTTVLTLQRVLHTQLLGCGQKRVRERGKEEEEKKGEEEGEEGENEEKEEGEEGT